MRDEKISDFLARLADRVPAPGGGASAALHAAQAADAYKLPQDTDAAKAARSAAIATALVGAGKPPAEVIAVAQVAVGLAEELLPIGNRNVITDIAAATEAARAAATTARLNVEINLGGITDEQARAELTAESDKVDDIAARAEQVTAAVRKEIST